ncbi:uncharacterized protein LOC112084455 [Eutrema salsugineum]|uniref:uncharacterized protein LOC112084455 n=1 Tax=Eutrema salsugineum TaxID=72664 RepID=UPI000CED6B7C|nr:uncharacterized protein LOC112084455 [Eutrema salsugineum]
MTPLDRSKYTTEMWVAKIRETNAKDTSRRGITFYEEDAEGIDQTYNCPLVIQIRVADCDVIRVLIDTGSLVDLIFKEALEKMDLRGIEMKPSVTPLTGFAGDTITAIGTIKLPVYVSRVAFDEGGHIDLPPMPQVPQPGRTVRSNKRVSRSCFIIEHKLCNAARTQLCATISRKGIPTCNVVEPGLSGNQTKKTVRSETSSFNDIPDISPTICSQELNVDPTFRPIKKKRRKLGVERAQAVNDEVERLLAVGQITEMKYPDWLANPVVVKNKNCKWRVCVDFTDVKKASSKDSFPLP